LPSLESFCGLAPQSFWNVFPKNYPKELCRKVDVGKLRKLISKCKSDWTVSQKRTAAAAVNHLEGKTLAPISKTLPALFEINASSAVENGELMTDALASWVTGVYIMENTPPPRGGGNISQCHLGEKI
jgi:hypothetical protein